MPASQCADSQQTIVVNAAHPKYRQRIGDSTKAVDNDGHSENPMSPRLRAHPWCNDQQDAVT